MRAGLIAFRHLLVGFRHLLPLVVWVLLPLGRDSPCLAADGLGEALVQGAFHIDVRYRFEFVDQDGFSKDAKASTLRTRLGYGTGEYLGFSLYGEVEDIRAIGNDLFNSTVNRRTGRPVVPDPEESGELNQAYLQYRGLPDTVARAGRQVVYFDNQRFISELPFRQNQQTFDAFQLTNRSLPDTTVDYVFIDKVHRTFSDESPVGNFAMDSHLVHLEYAGFDLGKLVGYAYLLDFARAENADLSSATFGVRFTGSYPVARDVGLLYAAEFAHQVDFTNNPRDFALNYFLGELGARYGDITVKLGYEVLGGDGTNGLQTPLATSHAFFGWADQVVATPPTGARDLYVKAGATVAGVALTGAYHDIEAEEGGADFGHEWDARIAKTFFRHVTAELIYANYASEGFAVDTEKFWFSLRFEY